MSETFPIIYGDPRYFQALHRSIGEVARERIFIEMIEAPELVRLIEFHGGIIEAGLPQYLALDGERVIGWAEISRGKNPRMQHRGHLGMGILKDFRGKGLGARLLKSCLDHAPKCGIEKVELQVYTDNVPAIRLYEKNGFVKTGTIKHFRKLDGRYFDVYQMERFL